MGVEETLCGPAGFTQEQSVNYNKPTEIFAEDREINSNNSVLEGSTNRLEQR